MMRLFNSKYAAKIRLPSATRMELARDLRGIEIEKLSADLEVDPRIYEKWEEVQEDEQGNGIGSVRDYEVPPSQSFMLRLSLYLCFPVAWFYAPEVHLSAFNSISWVSGSNFQDQMIEEEMARIEEELKAGKKKK